MLKKRRLREQPEQNTAEISIYKIVLSVDYANLIEELKTIKMYQEGLF